MYSEYNEKKFIKKTKRKKKRFVCCSKIKSLFFFFFPISFFALFQFFKKKRGKIDSSLFLFFSLDSDPSMEKFDFSPEDIFANSADPKPLDEFPEPRQVHKSTPKKLKSPAIRSRKTSDAPLYQGLPNKTGILDPVIRWRCQRLLQCCMGHTRIEPMRTSNKTVDYCRQLEEVIYMMAINQYERYQKKVQQLAHALKEVGSTLMDKYDPLQLVAIDDGLLAEDTAQEKNRQDIENRVNACRSLLANTDIFDDKDLNVAMVRCRACKGTDVMFQPFQTRGGDEGMTIYCTCQNELCGNRWSFRG
jgi:DNA-directed RNA polymerase subunit M/transcription elongation factor TFIIS